MTRRAYHHDDNLYGSGRARNLRIVYRKSSSLSSSPHCSLGSSKDNSRPGLLSLEYMERGDPWLTVVPCHSGGKSTTTPVATSRSNCCALVGVHNPVDWAWVASVSLHPPLTGRARPPVVVTEGSKEVTRS